MSARPLVLGWAQTARGRALELLEKEKIQGESIIGMLYLGWLNLSRYAFAS
jgi:precorrin isomerase